MQDLIRHKGKLNFGSGYIYFLNTGQDNRYVIQKRVVRKHKTWKKCRHDQVSFDLYKGKSRTVPSAGCLFEHGKEYLLTQIISFFPIQECGALNSFCPSRTVPEQKD